MIHFWENIKACLQSVLRSYSQVFFSNDRGFALLLIFVTFFDLNAGLSGLLAVIVSNSLAYFAGFDRNNIKCGYYGFNSLLVALGLGVHYNPNPEYFIVLFFASILTLFITLAMEGVIGKYGLPYLSIPFLLSTWMVVLAARQLHTLVMSDRGIYALNEINEYGGIRLISVYKWFLNLNLHESVIIYLKSLGAIFFQYNVLAGIIVVVGLIYHSRISFLLSVLGFYTAYFYYHIIGANINELSDIYIGYNYILTAVAIGGFFIVSSRSSFIWVILLVPLISIVMSSSIAVFNLMQLPVVSLPFNMIVLLFLYMLKFRKTKSVFPEPVTVQLNSPEKNLYYRINNKKRFWGFLNFSFSLPFKGKWNVSQGYAGEITHKDDWRHAIDFVIKDSYDRTYKNAGLTKEDFYAFSKPVVAPADGWIEEIRDGIPDNEIADMNTRENWGNTIIIRHVNQLYSQVSHLLINSVKVFKGSYVKRGDVIASCGNSGRSPEPHIHFQIQTTPFIGSRTLSYPISHYILKKDNQYELKSFNYPIKDDVISNIELNNSLYNAFHFIPGQKLSISIERYGRKEIVKWEIQTDIFNNSYIFCQKTNSKAWFINYGDIHYFTSFEGDQKSSLFSFYLSAFQVIMGFYKGLVIKDNFPLTLMNKNFLNVLQDFIAPFYIFLHSEYKMEYFFIEDYLDESTIIMKSETIVRVGRIVTKQFKYELHIGNNRIEKLVIID